MLYSYVLQNGWRQGSIVVFYRRWSTTVESEGATRKVTTVATRTEMWENVSEGAVRFETLLLVNCFSSYFKGGGALCFLSAHMSGTPFSTGLCERERKGNCAAGSGEAKLHVSSCTLLRLLLARPTLSSLCTESLNMRGCV